MSDANRREHPRFDISLAAAVTLDDGHEISCSARNLSQGGVGVRLAEPLSEGSSVEVDLFLVEEGIEDATTPTFSVTATVMWLAKVDERSFEAGLRFGALAPEPAQLLEHYLARLQA
ncbi:MAG: PilZ domain-containing protein [Myxococcales bacterium]|nr:PilZ domain-containing protein [Myxococcales bacterium]